MHVPLLTGVVGIGKEILSDKGIRSAERRVGPLRQQTELPRSVIIDHMVDRFRSKYGLTEGSLSAEDEAEAARWAEEQFGRPEWIYFLP